MSDWATSTVRDLLWSDLSFLGSIYGAIWILGLDLESYVRIDGTGFKLFTAVDDDD